MESSLQSIQNLVCNVLVALNGGVAVGSGLRTGNVHIGLIYVDIPRAQTAADGHPTVKSVHL